MILNGFRIAFALSLAEAKPVAAFTRNADREISDEDEFNNFVMPHINRHRAEGDAVRVRVESILDVRDRVLDLDEGGVDRSDNLG